MKYEFKPSHIVPAFLFVVAVLYGGSKPPSSTNEPPVDIEGDTAAITNEPPEIVDGDAPTNAAPPVLMASRPRLATSAPPANYHLPTTNYQLITNWTARGAYCDWQRIDFRDGFRFPVGTNFIDGVTLFAYGEVRIKRGSGVSPLVEDGSSASLTSAEDGASPLTSSPSTFTYSLPSRVSIEPNASSLTHGLTPSNTYLFAWSNCCANRLATNRVDASIELFRSGAVVTTVTPLSTPTPPTYTYQPAVPPAGFPGHGQDEAWVRATFPDEADAILSQGYTNWLSETFVGIDAENGHYQAAVTVAALPADGTPSYLVCGPYRVNVVEPGVYRFPLNVFETYEVRTYPTAVPFTVAFDDGYTGEEESYEIVDATPRPRLFAASPAASPTVRPPVLTAIRPWLAGSPVCFYLWPKVVVRPSHVSRLQADGTRISFWCNLANVTRRFFRTASSEFYLNFCWPSDAEIIAADEELEDELEAEEEVEIEVVYECPQGECSGWLTIDEWHPVNPHEPPQREDASVYSGPAWQTTYTNGSLVCWLTVATTDGSTEAHEGTGAVVLDEGQYAEVSVYMATTEYGGDIYDDEVEWQVLVNGTAAMSGNASVSSGVFGSPLATQRFDPPADGTLRLRLVGRARNVADGLRQSCIRIVVRVIDEGDAPAHP